MSLYHFDTTAAESSYFFNFFYFSSLSFFSRFLSGCSSFDGYFFFIGCGGARFLCGLLACFLFLFLEPLLPGLYSPYDDKVSGLISIVVKRVFFRWVFWLSWSDTLSSVNFLGGRSNFSRVFGALSLDLVFLPSPLPSSPVS